MTARHSEAENFDEYFSLPVAYSLPHDWGHFSVTELADEDYGLVPLTPEIIRNGIDLTPLAPDAIEVLLIGRDENHIWDRLNTKPAEWATTRVYVSSAQETAANGLRVVCGFARTRQDMLAAEIEKYAQNYGETIENFKARFGSEDGIPVSDYLAQSIGTTLIHNLYNPLGASITEGLRQRRNRIVRWLPMSGVLDLFFAGQIVDDIHNDLCPEYFDQKFKENF